MRLGEWLAAQGKNRRDFAVLIGISEAYLSQLCLGRVRGPSAPVIAKIERATDMAVTASDLLAVPAAE